MRLETSLISFILTFVKTFEFLLQFGHVLFKLDRFLFFGVILSVSFQIYLGHLFVFTVELVQFQDWVRLSLRIRRVVSEFVSFPVLLYAHFVALLAKSKVEALSTVDA